MLLALSMVLSYVEAMIPINLGIPGVKLGLPNIVTMIGIYSIGAWPTIVISILRILLVSFMFGNTMTLAYSFSGFILSFCSMILLKKVGGFSGSVVSIMGGVMHNVGQLLAAIVILHTKQLALYFPVLLVAGVISGAIIGLIAGLISKRIRLYLQTVSS